MIYAMLIVSLSVLLVSSCAALGLWTAGKIDLAIYRHTELWIARYFVLFGLGITAGTLAAIVANNAWVCIVTFVVANALVLWRGSRRWQ